MYCPNCNKEFDGKFCPECGTKLVEKNPAGTGVSINLGDANAISGGVVVNNSTTYLYERDKTQKEVEQENRIIFMNLCNAVFEDGIFDEEEVLKVESERQRLGIDKKAADKIIDLARRSAQTLKKELSPMDAVFLKTVTRFVQSNDVSHLKMLVPKLEALSGLYKVDGLRYTLNLVLSGLFPEKLIRSYEDESGDSYWQTFWATAAYLKKGEVGKAEKAMSKLNLYKDYPESNVALLSAFISSFEYGNEVAKDYLSVIEEEPCSPELEPFYEALVLEIDPETAAFKGVLSDKTEFFMTNLIRIANPYKKVLANAEMDLAQKKEEEMARLFEIYDKGCDYLYGRWGKRKDLREALKWIRMAAELGYPEAQCELGGLFYSGTGVENNYTEAVKWFHLAAEQGQIHALYNLGLAYYWGNGVIQDYVEAAKWYRKAADQGYACGERELGRCYEDGKGVAQDYDEAVKWYRKAADKRDSCAQVLLGICYEDGKGVAQDYDEAVKWYRKAADQGDQDGQNNLGNCFYDGTGVQQSYTEAVKWFRKAADQGHAGAQDNLGYCYAKGKGVAQDYVEAIRWFRKAADQEHDNALSNLGECYYWGHGVEKDEDMAKEFWKRAAEKGNQDAIDYLNGKIPEP